MDLFQPPGEYILNAINSRSDELKAYLFAMYIKFVADDLGNDIMHDTTEGVPQVITFMQELAEKEQMPVEIQDAIHAFSDSTTMATRKMLIDAIDQYVAPIDGENEVVRNAYLDIQFPGRPKSHETE